MQRLQNLVHHFFSARQRQGPGTRTGLLHLHDQLQHARWLDSAGCMASSLHAQWGLTRTPRVNMKPDRAVKVLYSLK